MKARFGAVLALMTALVPLAGASTLGGGERAFVVAEDDDMLVAIELPRAVVARVRLPNGPHNVAASPEGRYVAVTSPPAGALTLIRPHPVRVLATIRGLDSPHDVEFGRDPREREPSGAAYAYVTEERGAVVAVVDLLARRVVRRVRVANRPHDLAVSGDGSRVWITHGPRAQRLTVLDTREPERATVHSRPRAHGAAHDITWSADGRRVWVTYWNSGIVAAFDARTARRVLAVRAGENVHHVIAAPHGRAVWTTDHATGRAARLHPSGRLVRTIRVGHAPHHVAVGPFRGHVVVASHETGRIAVYDQPTRRLSFVRVGRGLHGVAIAPVP